MRGSRTLSRLTFGLASFVLGHAMAWAGIGSSSLTAQTSVNANCTVSTTPVAFGAYDPIGVNQASNLNVSGSVTITCVKGTAPTVGLGLGANASGSIRRMKDATSGDFLTYELYKPPNTTPGTACSYPGTTVWGTAGANLFSATSAPNKNARSYNVCGTVPAGQDPSVGTYTDTVVATVSF